MASPVIYEIDVWPWLNELSRECGREVRLEGVPDAEWDKIASYGFDAVWLMGVWERSPAGARIAREHPDLQASYRDALPDFKPEDIVGSPYAVHRYVVDAHLGGPDGLKAAREQLLRRNLRLILDFVPNHVAIDHPWTREHPEYFIHDGDGSIANGRDPYFPAWTDTAQINVFQRCARSALIETLAGIAEQCDGVRCDMSMLLLNDVFRKTWGERAGAAIEGEFWTEAVAELRRRHSGFVLIGEVYWGLDAEMQQLGFNYCYDKLLYDRMRYGDADAIRNLLERDVSYQRKLLRFLENHDEARAAAAFGGEKERAAAVVMSTIPGAKLLHEGQFEGRQVKAPVQLGRRREEPVNEDLQRFHKLLMAARRDGAIRDGEWKLLDTTGWPDNQSHRNLLAWSRTSPEERVLVVVNYAGTASQGRVRVPWNDLRGASWPLADPLTGDVFVRAGDEMAEAGLFVDLGAWGSHWLRMERVAG